MFNFYLFLYFFCFSFLGYVFLDPSCLSKVWLMSKHRFFNQKKFAFSVLFVGNVRCSETELFCWFTQYKSHCNISYSSHCTLYLYQIRHCILSYYHLYSIIMPVVYLLWKILYRIYMVWVQLVPQYKVILIQQEVNLLVLCPETSRIHPLWFLSYYV